ncbi:MAG: hypothetical protein ACOCYE_08735 [Pseudomonadota bacterium]
MQRPVFVLVVLPFVTGCAGPNVVGAGTERAAFIDAGARRIAAEERAPLLAGNTLVAEGVRVHYAPDGTKTVRLDDGLTLERAWRVREDGIMCEELTVSGVEVCADQGVLYERDGEFRAFRLDGSATPMSFRIVEGEALAPGDEVSAR